ncbi:MAG: patatin-like phospholipase family protein [Thermoanaerobaculia bacterium]|nr:patatin-like phospholipase family protein [Thermoanaerobaculia bacterium]
MATEQSEIRRVLYFPGRRTLAAPFFRAMGGLEECRLRTRGGEPTVICREAALSFVERHAIDDALAALHSQYFNLVLLDLREPVDNGARRSRPAFERGLTLLEAMDREPDIERRYGFHRIFALVSGPDPIEVDRQIAALGAVGVRHVLRDPSTPRLGAGPGEPPDEVEFSRVVLREMKRVCTERLPGKVALCISGGGITGLYFELGVLKCLEDCLPPGALNRLDLYFGISAGSVLSGMLANGFSVTEFMAAVSGEGEGRIEPLDLNLLDFAHLDLRGLSAPLRQVFSLASRGASELLRGRLPFSLESLIFEYGDLFHAPFRTDGFGDLLRRAFSRPGHTDDFRQLPRPLYVGATDQDLKEHVLFGEAPHDEVPISIAIQASMSLNPVFAPTPIGDRFYEDGAVTRTSNFGDAIRKGADLVFTIDPIVPYVSKRAGFARGRGVFYNADQDIRTVSFTRYDTTRNWALRRHPEVSLYTFLPPNNLRRILSVNPMDHRPYREIWRGAYLGTLKRLEALGYRLRGDLHAHGLAFDPRPAEEVAARLATTRNPQFADFFPDGRVEIRPAEPPLAPARPKRKPRSRVESPAA